MRRYIGLGKTLYNSSVCSLEQKRNSFDLEVLISERFDRKKNSGKSPITLLPNLGISDVDECLISESADVAEALEKEMILNENFPFFEYLKQKDLENFSRNKNPKIKTIGHHEAHASAAVLRAPFTKALVFILDGAGSSVKTLLSLKDSEEKKFATGRSSDEYEHLSVYLFDQGKLQIVKKDFMKFERVGELSFGTSIGIFYETIAKYIFSSQTDPGKVMGLAPFGKGYVVQDLLGFQKSLDWNRAFKGKDKSSWESHLELAHFKELAAIAQMTFEDFFLKEIESLQKQYPEYSNLILSGGCALNCTANWKLKNKNLFKEIYVPPNPGDESIGMGAAASQWFLENSSNWKPLPWSLQNSFLGHSESAPSDEVIEENFKDFSFTKSNQIELDSAEALSGGEVIAWFQGRSECGPRALGHRSILARPDRSDLKSYLNDRIKFRESFRPYGCTVLKEEAPKYFEVSEDFHNPFMSFAVPVKKEFLSFLQHVTHIDHTSRMQTLTEEQEPLFYKLLIELRRLTGHGVVLNTSLNVMNEPILETVEDALRFFKNSEVDALVIGNYIIRKN